MVDLVLETNQTSNALMLTQLKCIYRLRQYVSSVDSHMYALFLQLAKHIHGDLVIMVL